MTFKKDPTPLEERTDSFLQAHFIKGTYYNDKGQYDDNLLQGATLLVNYDKDNDMAEKLDRWSEIKSELAMLKSKKSGSFYGNIYMSVREKDKLDRDIVELESEYSSLRNDIIRYIEKSMAKKKLLKTRITRLQLQKIPLILAGGQHDSNKPAEDDEEDSDDEEEVEML